MENSDVSVSTSKGRGSGEMVEPMGTSSDSAIAVEHSEYVTAFEGGMMSSRCSTSAEDLRRTHVVWLKQKRRECRSEEEFATGSPSSLTSSLTEEEKCKIRVTNKQFFQELIKKQPPTEQDWDYLRSRLNLKRSAFFTDFGDRLEVGKKIAQGGQAEIYEAIFPETKTVFDTEDLRGFYVLKVFALEHSQQFQHAWAKQSESIPILHELWLEGRSSTIKNCTLLKDGRFAFLMVRYWGDLRKAITIQILKDKTHCMPPFPPSISTFIMFQIALWMRDLHRRGTLHRDLKAENVLVTDDIETCLTETPIQVRLFYCHVADFDSTEGVLGTGFWRAPEVLNILKSPSKDKYSDPTIWTKKVDVYAFAMTCYEVLSGCIPFGIRAANDYNIGDERPPLPDYVDQEIKELLRKCWDSDPLKRPTFEIICDDLEKFGSMKVMYCRALAEDQRDDEAILWLSVPDLYTK